MSNLQPLRIFANLFSNIGNNFFQTIRWVCHGGEWKFHQGLTQILWVLFVAEMVKLRFLKLNVETWISNFLQQNFHFLFSSRSPVNQSEEHHREKHSGEHGPGEPECHGGHIFGVIFDKHQAQPEAILPPNLTGIHLRWRGTVEVDFLLFIL